MNIKKSFGIILLILFTSQIFLIFSSNNIENTTLSTQSLKISQSLEEIYFNPKAGIGFEPVKSNIMRDGGFEEDDAVDGPKYFYYYGSGYEVSNASYQVDVHSGSYGYYLSVKGTDQYPCSSFSSRYLPSIPERAYLVEDISLDMWFKNKANPDISNGAYAYMYLRIYSGVLTYNLYYAFTSTGSLPGNTTTEAYFDVRQPIGSWVNLQRNITGDFEAAFPSVPITSSFYIENIYFTANSPDNPMGAIEILADDIVIANKTAFNYLYQNGDFEYGDGYGWNNYKRGPSSAKLSDDDYTEGAHSLNLTSHAYFEGDSFSYLSCYKGVGSGSFALDTYYPIEPGAVVINFDWKYTDTLNGGDNQDGYYYLNLKNGTYNVYLYFMLGKSDDAVTSGNITTSFYMQRYYAAPGFGNRDTWEHFSLDLYELIQLENLQNQVPTYNGWGTDAGLEANSTVTLLLDDYSFTANPVGDPSFEQAENWLPNDPLNSWSSVSHFYVNRTTDAHSGVYACNTTAFSGSGNSYCYRYGYLPIDANLYTDFWWRLDECSGPSMGYSYLYLLLDSNHMLYYIFGLTDSSVFFNSTNTYYYYVENQNQTGTWFNLFRNVQNDAFVAFGEANWNITEIRMGSYATGTTSIATIFDDIYFVRDAAGPEITNLVQTPLEPQYGEAVTIEVDVTDNVDVLAVEMFYRVGVSSWNGIPMTNTAGTHYESGIPGFDYNNIIQYYIVAYDIYGLDSLLGSDITPFEYTVTDTIDPILNVEAPQTSDPIIGNVIFNISGEDPGSGIALCEIVLDTETVFSDVNIPTNYTWVTTYLDNGNHTIVFTLEDNAGNVAIIELEYTVDNLVPWYVRAKTFLQKWYPYIVAGAGVLIIGVTTLAIVIRVRRRRKAT